MSTNDVISGLCERYSVSENFIQISKPYLESIAPSFFRGAIHAEATLMLLISYFTLDDHRRNEEILNRDTFEEFFRPALPNPAIATGKKCCWCCEKLSQLVHPILMPGSHGTIYPWCPPRGINIVILETLESQLWAKLFQGLKDKHRSTDSHQSLGSSSIDDSEIISIYLETDDGLEFSEITIPDIDTETGQRSDVL